MSWDSIQNLPRNYAEAKAFLLEMHRRLVGLAQTGKELPEGDLEAYKIAIYVYSAYLMKVIYWTSEDERTFKSERDMDAILAQVTRNRAPLMDRHGNYLENPLAYISLIINTHSPPPLDIEFVEEIDGSWKVFATQFCYNPGDAAKRRDFLQLFDTLAATLSDEREQFVFRSYFSHLVAAERPVLDSDNLLPDREAATLKKIADDLDATIQTVWRLLAKARRQFLTSLLQYLDIGRKLSPLCRASIERWANAYRRRELRYKIGRQCMKDFASLLRESI